MSDAFTNTRPAPRWHEAIFEATRADFIGYAAR